MEDYPNSYLYRRIVAAKLYIDRHYATKLDLGEIAGEACFSRFHFIRLFRSVYGFTPHQYLVRVRMQHARALLAIGMPVMQVCLEVGFESSGSFASLFKRVNGTTPSVYQQWQLQERKAQLTAPRRYIPGCFARALSTADEKSNFGEPG
jgi:AraC-like DNA-binding protein